MSVLTGLSGSVCRDGADGGRHRPVRGKTRYRPTETVKIFPLFPGPRNGLDGEGPGRD